MAKVKRQAGETAKVKTIDLIELIALMHENKMVTAIYDGDGNSFPSVELSAKVDKNEIKIKFIVSLTSDPLTMMCRALYSNTVCDVRFNGTSVAYISSLEPAICKKVGSLLKEIDRTNDKKVETQAYSEFESLIGGSFKLS